MEISKEGVVVIAIIISIFYWIGMNKIFDRILELRKLKKLAPKVKAVIEKYEIEEDSDGYDLHRPIICVEGLGRFKYENGSVPSNPEYNEGDVIELYLDESDFTQSVLVGDPIEGVLIFLSLLLGAGVPFSMVLMYFG